MTDEELEDYKERLIKAGVEVAQLAKQYEEGLAEQDAARLRGKAQGIALALDYLRGYK